MLRLFNTLGRRMEDFRPLNSRLVTVFTCGPSVYQRSHIGNFRTFLFEDVLVRYLRYSGYNVLRGMNITDMEDKAIEEARRRRISLTELTERNIREFVRDMKLLGMKIPDYLPKASDYVGESAAIIEELIRKGIAYRHKRDVYFDPLKFPGFGKLFGLDMSRWPKKKRRFHKDTYPGIQWNLGDFILWFGYRKGDPVFRETMIGRGRPSWNIQDASIVASLFHETLSIYCGGIDNLFRHHDYTLAVLESVRPYPMAKYWLHANHLFVEGKKMSKSRGNIYYTDTLMGKDHRAREIRFFLICSRYREKLDYSEAAMGRMAEKLRGFRKKAARVLGLAGAKAALADGASDRLRRIFSENMDNDLDVAGAFEGMDAILSEALACNLPGGEAASLIKALRGIDEVLGVIF